MSEHAARVALVLFAAFIAVGLAVVWITETLENR